MESEEQKPKLSLNEHQQIFVQVLNKFSMNKLVW